MKNIGGPHGGALTAGLILQEFVADEIPWAHLDIAGPAFTDSDDAEITKGGTGFGVRLLAELAVNFTARSASRTAPRPPEDRKPQTAALRMASRCSARVRPRLDGAPRPS